MSRMYFSVHYVAKSPHLSVHPAMTWIIKLFHTLLGWTVIAQSLLTSVRIQGVCNFFVLIFTKNINVAMTTKLNSWWAGEVVFLAGVRVNSHRTAYYKLYATTIAVPSFVSGTIAGQDSSVSGASYSCAKGGGFEPHCQQVDSASYPSVGRYLADDGDWQNLCIPKRFITPTGKPRYGSWVSCVLPRELIWEGVAPPYKGVTQWKVWARGLNVIVKVPLIPWNICGKALYKWETIHTKQQVASGITIPNLAANCARYSLQHVDYRLVWIVL